MGDSGERKEQLNEHLRQHKIQGRKEMGLGEEKPYEYATRHDSKHKTLVESGRKGWDGLERDLPTQPAPSNAFESDTLKAITPKPERTLSCPTFPFDTFTRANIL